MAAFLSALFWGLLMLSILVFIHEAGHFLFARKFGARVTEFFLGMPCKIRLAFRSKKYGTLIGVTPLLLGGYNKICGMEGFEDERLQTVLGMVARSGRIDASAISAELNCSDEETYELLATLVDWASIEPYYNPELGESEDQKDWPKAFQTVARDTHGRTMYDPGYDPSLPGAKQAGEPWDKPFEDAGVCSFERRHTYLGCSFIERFIILVAGPLFNLLTSIILVFFVLSVLGVDIASNSTRIGEVIDSSLAETAGIEAGDELIRIGDVDVSSWDELSEPIQAYLAQGEDFDVVLMRNGQELTVHVRLEEGEEHAGLGIYSSLEKMRMAPLDAARVAFGYAGQVAAYVVQLIIPTHTLEVLDQSSSVVGIANMASQAAESGVSDFLMLSATVSMSLCFMNLLPIPPLDGGKILIEIIQAIRRKPISRDAHAIVSYIGLAFFLFVFVYVLRLDILRIFTG